MRGAPASDFARLRAAAEASPAGGRTARLRLLTDGGGAFLAEALRAEARCRGWEMTVECALGEDVTGMLWALGEVASGDASAGGEEILVVPTVEALFEQFLATPVAERGRFGEERAALWAAARQAVAERGATLWWGTLVPFVDGIDGAGQWNGAASFRRQIGVLEAALLDATAGESSLRLFDLGGLAAFHGRAVTYDERWWRQARMPFALDFLPQIAYHFLNQWEAARGGAPKVVVCDLDETLWGGILDEVGPRGLVLIGAGEGAAYAAFQNWLRALRERGLLLALCSKNDEAAALEVVRSHPEMRLRLTDFVGWRINWRPKSENLRALAAELGLGLEHFVFLDDQPFERAEVRAACPEVIVPELPSAVEERLPFLQSLQLFAPSGRAATGDEPEPDRTAQYQVEAARRREQAGFSDYQTYLASLRMEAQVATLTESNLARVLELSLRSNQFNLRTHRYAEAELRELLGATDRVWVIVSVRDRFGDYGLVAVVEAVIGESETGTGGDDGSGEVAVVRNWLMSCRVLQRGVEKFTRNALVERLRARGVRTLRMRYEPTAKNGLVASLPDVLGLETLANGDWQLPLETALPLETCVQALKTHE